jgi:hypothetical protein
LERLAGEDRLFALVQSLTQYLAGGKRGNLDAGIAVGAIKELSFPANFVGRNLRVTKPDKQNAEVTITGEKDRATAALEDNDRSVFTVCHWSPAAIKIAAHRKSMPSMRHFWNRAWTKSAPPNLPRSLNRFVPRCSMQSGSRKAAKESTSLFRC